MSYLDSMRNKIHFLRWKGIKIDQGTRKMYSGFQPLSLNLKSSISTYWSVWAADAYLCKVCFFLFRCTLFILCIFALIPMFLKQCVFILRQNIFTIWEAHLQSVIFLYRCILFKKEYLLIPMFLLEYVFIPA